MTARKKPAVLAKPHPPQTNRIVAIVTVLLAAVGAIAPVVANMDWTSTAGIIAGVAAVAAVAVKWLDGWQKHEDRQALDAPVPLEPGQKW